MCSDQARGVELESSFHVAGRLLGDEEHPCWIVAEISANHRQDRNEAAALIRAAAEAGADAVKTQTYRPETMTLPLREGPFLHRSAGSLWAGRSLWDLYEEGYLPWEWQSELKQVAEDAGLAYFSSAYDRSSVDFLDRLEVPALKIASFELVDLPLIEYAASTGRPLILSTGMATLEEVQEAVDAARSGGARRLVLLKCTSSYPTRSCEVHLRGMVTLARRFRTPVGFSDHTPGVEAATAAVAAGASVVEKHFLRENAATLDAEFSLAADGFRRMVEAIRRVEILLGRAELGPLPCEEESLGFRRSLYVVRDIRAGEVFTEDNIRSIRPAGGLAPKLLPRVLGRRAKRGLRRGEALKVEDVEGWAGEP